MNQEERRDRQRKRVKRRYYRTIHSLSQSRELVEKLTEKHHHLIKQCELAASPEHDTLRRYTEALTTADQLRQEKQRLIEVIEDRQRIQDRVMTLMDESRREQVGVFARPVQGASWISQLLVKKNPDSYVDPAVLPVSLRSLALTECEEITRANFASIKLFLERESYISTNSAVFGWRDKRRMTGRSIQMTLDKVLSGFSPFDLAVKTWRLLQGQFDYNKLFSASLGSSIQCLQTVNDTNMVLQHNFASIDDFGPFHALYLATLVKIDWGYAVLFQSIDRAKFEVKTNEKCEDRWLDVHMCYLFRTHATDHSKNHVLVGGKMAGSSAKTMKTWMMELLLVCLRWENIITGLRTLVES